MNCDCRSAAPTFFIRKTCNTGRQARIFQPRQNKQISHKVTETGDGGTRENFVPLSLCPCGSVAELYRPCSEPVSYENDQQSDTRHPSWRLQWRTVDSAL